MSSWSIIFCCWLYFCSSWRLFVFENLLSKWSWECILAICLDNRWVRVALSSKQFSWWYHWPRGSTVEQLVENDDQPIAVTPGSSQGSQRPHQLPRWPTRVTWQKARSQHMQVKILCWACCFDCYDCRESWVTLGIFLRRKMSNRAGQGWGWVMKGQGSKAGTGWFIHSQKITVEELALMFVCSNCHLSFSVVHGIEMRKNKGWRVEYS